MRDLAFLAVCFGLGTVGALVFCVVFYRGLPEWRAVRARFAEQRRASTPYGRVLYPLFLFGVLLLCAAFVGTIDRSVRSALGFALVQLPIHVLLYVFPSLRAK